MQYLTAKEIEGIAQLAKGLTAWLNQPHGLTLGDVPVIDANNEIVGIVTTNGEGADGLLFAPTQSPNVEFEPDGEGWLS